jgi:hypothetical protein
MMLKLLMALVEQQTQEILSVLLLVIWVVSLQEILEYEFSINANVTKWLVKLKLRIEVLLYMHKLHYCSFWV